MQDSTNRWIGTGHDDSWNRMRDRWFDRKVTLKRYNQKYHIWSEVEMEKRFMSQMTRRKNEKKKRRRSKSRGRRK